MEFEWDEAKREKTIRERALDFRYAITIFRDPNRIEGVSRRKDGEDRHYVIGAAAEGELLFVVFTWRHHGNETQKVCRIISARAAHKVERKRYASLH